MRGSRLKTLPSSTLFRAYDIRGIVGDNLHVADMLALGQAFASEVIARTQNSRPAIVLGRDGRLSSEALSFAMRDGLISAGAHVLDIGMGPSPYAYFAAHHHEAEGCVMITGSHNPKDHNGMKVVIAGHTLHGDDLYALRTRLEEGRIHQGHGSHEACDMQAEYAAALLREISAYTLAFPVIWDAGNGAAGNMISQIVPHIAAMQHELLFCEIDGHFPNHHPDPSNPKNLVDLQRAVTHHTHAIGLAFDGDGDRLGVLDENGHIVTSDQLLMLLARDVLAASPHATIIADVKTSDAVFHDVRAHGGQAIMGRTGHALMKEMMRETQAAFAGEASGHLFFADRYYGFDDGIYAAIRLLALVAKSGKRLCDLVGSLPVIYASPEWRIDCDDQKKFDIIAQIAAALHASGAEVNTLDGVRVSTADGWWLLRASNTQGALVGRAEGRDADTLARVVQAVAVQLAAFGLHLPAA